MDEMFIRLCLKPRAIWLWLAVALLTPLVAVCHGQSREAELQWELAEHLLAKGEPYRAITEYERFLFYFPSHPKASLARVRVVEAYVAGRWWEDGAKAAREALGRSDLSQEARNRLLELLGLCLMRMGRSDLASEHLQMAYESSQEPVAKSRLGLLLAQLRVSQGDWDAAKGTLESLEAPAEWRAVARRAIREMEISGPSRERSPWTAAALAAIVPGAGHAYLGRWEDAALTFCVNAAFLGASIEAVSKRQTALAAGMAAAELLWYSGNVFSAVSNAHKHNQVLRQRWVEGVRLEQIPSWDGHSDEAEGSKGP